MQELLIKHQGFKKRNTLFCMWSTTSQRLCHQRWWTLLMCDSKKKLPNVIIIPDVIRRSHIETYKSCPYKFYMEVIKGIKDPSSVYATIGIDLHELFSKACHDKNYVEQQMVENYLKIWDNYNSTIFEDEQQQSTLKQRALNSIKKFLHN